MPGSDREASRKYASVAVNLPLYETFTYRIPPPLQCLVSPGVRVLVPFGRRTLTGFVTVYPAPVPKGVTVRDILRVQDPEPVLTPGLLNLAKWISDYYMAPLGTALSLAVPRGMDSRSVEVAVITAKGRRALPYVANPAERRILGAVSDKEIRVTTLERRFKGEKVPSILKGFRRQGLVEIRQAMQEETVREKREKFYFLKNDPSRTAEDKNPRAPKRAAIRRFLSGGERSLGEIRSAFENPTPVLKRLVEAGVVGVSEKTRYRSPLGETFPLEAAVETPKTLTPDQARVFTKIREWIHAREFRSLLLHGVTGSGKTEIYLQAISETIRQGRQAILLVPEISLTPQMITRIQARFGKKSALLHSGLSVGERYDEWRRIRKGEVDIAVGARSAVFAPFSRLGIIIVDEEHETSFKQEESPRYHAREVALVRAKACGALVILGSATPSLESLYNVRTGKNSCLVLKNRISDHPMPGIEMLDMRAPGRGFTGTILSETLRQSIKEALDRKEQVFLFLNRRGTSHFLQCEECGLTLTCPHCSVTLTYHGRVREMRCHYCNFFTPAPEICPACGGHRIRFRGYGTQKLEEEVRDFFPDARTARMDRDAVRTKGSFFRIFRQLSAGEIDILIGTQMIAKGHDFPNVTLVGIVNADASLNVPDFRSGERTFQLIAQVAGRAGRAKKPGRVIVQTYNPDHYVFRFLRDYDFDGLCQREEEARKALLYPPFSRLALLSFESARDDLAEEGARQTARDLQSQDPKGASLKILGPSRAIIHKVKDVYRWRLLLKGGDFKRFRRFLSRYVSPDRLRKRLPREVRVSLDIDPARI